MEKRRERAEFGGAEQPQVQHPQLHFCSWQHTLGQSLLVSSQPILNTPNIFRNLGSPRGSAVPLPSLHGQHAQRCPLCTQLPTPPVVCPLHHPRVQINAPVGAHVPGMLLLRHRLPGASWHKSLCRDVPLLPALLCSALRWWVGASGCREQRRGFHTSSLVI